MTRREKIIVGAMLLAVVYAVYILFLAEPRKPTPLAKTGGDRQLETLNAFITKVSEKAKTRLTKQEAYILQKAQEKWAQDPLVELRDAKSTGLQKTKPRKLEGGIQYSGFLQMGRRRLAIINGTEYEKGDKLEPGGYVIRGIYPNHVVLMTVDGTRQKFILQLEEMQ